MIATCGILGYYLVQDELAGRQAQGVAPEPSEFIPRDISSREADPEPLTADEVFPDEELHINPSEPPYEVLATQENDDCSVAAVDELATLLSELGCSQVVRATLVSPTEAYLVTGGILNLEDQQAAEQAYEEILPLVEEGTGRFLGMVAGDGTEPIVLSETVLFWDYRGHYLMYSVIARADGGEFSAADNQYADLISWDIIEVHLRNQVLQQRAVEPNPELAEQSAEDDDDDDNDNDNDDPDGEDAAEDGEPADAEG